MCLKLKKTENKNHLSRLNYVRVPVYSRRVFQELYNPKGYRKVYGIIYESGPNDDQINLPQTL